MARLLDRYKKEIVPQLKKTLKRDNELSLPRLQKIVVNMGVGKALQDKNRLEQSAEQLAQITGQKPQITIAKKAVSGFREIHTQRVDTDALRYFPNRDELLANFAHRTPAGPTLTPQDVAGAVYLLCLPEAAMITGHTLMVDGGFAISG